MARKFIFADDPAYQELVRDRSKDKSVVTREVATDYQLPMRYADGGEIDDPPYIARQDNTRLSLNIITPQQLEQIEAWKYGDERGWGHDHVLGERGRVGVHALPGMFNAINKTVPSSAEKSPYKPTKAKDPNAEYYTLSDMKNILFYGIKGIGFHNKGTDKFRNIVNKDAEKLHKENKNYRNIGGDSFNDWWGYYKDNDNPTYPIFPSFGNQSYIGKFKVDSGKDKKGKYLSIYDAGKTGVEYYDRVYEDEWKKHDKEVKWAEPQTPKYQEGGEIDGNQITVSSKEHPRYKAYQDSVNLYNEGWKLYNEAWGLPRKQDNYKMNTIAEIRNASNKGMSILTPYKEGTNIINSEHVQENIFGESKNRPIEYLTDTDTDRKLFLLAPRYAKPKQKVIVNERPKLSRLPQRTNKVTTKPIVKDYTKFRPKPLWATAIKQAKKEGKRINKIQIGTLDDGTNVYFKDIPNIDNKTKKKFGLDYFNK